METAAAAPASSSPAPASTGAPAQSGGLSKSIPDAMPGQRTQQPQQTKQPQQGGDQKEQTQTQSAPELFDVKINGKVQKLTREEVINLASMSQAATSKFQEAAKTRQQIESIINNVKKDPIQALLDPALGLTKEQVREAFENWYYKNEVEPSTLTEEQRKYRDIEAENQRYKAEREENEKRQREEHETQLTNKIREQIQTQIIEALDKHGLPKDPKVISRIAFHLRENNKMGWEAPMDFVVSQVKKEMKSDYQQQFTNSSVEQLYDLIGEENINKIIKYNLEKRRADRQKKEVPFTQQEEITAPNNGSKIDYDVVNKNLRELKLRGF